VRDSYYGLVNKTSHSLKWASGDTGPSPAYVMMLDDDVYLRVGELLRALKDSAPRHRFYAGQVGTYTRLLYAMTGMYNVSFHSRALFHLPSFTPSVLSAGVGGAVQAPPPAAAQPCSPQLPQPQRVPLGRAPTLRHRPTLHPIRRPGEIRGTERQPPQVSTVHSERAPRRV
jgi:hypothetical protein